MKHQNAYLTLIAALGGALSGAPAVAQIPDFDNFGQDPHLDLFAGNNPQFVFVRSDGFFGRPFSDQTISESAWTVQLSFVSAVDVSFLVEFELQGDDVVRGMLNLRANEPVILEAFSFEDTPETAMRNRFFTRNTTDETIGIDVYIGEDTLAGFVPPMLGRDFVPLDPVDPGADLSKFFSISIPSPSTAACMGLAAIACNRRRR